MTTQCLSKLMRAQGGWVEGDVEALWLHLFQDASHSRYLILQRFPHCLPMKKRRHPVYWCLESLDDCNWCVAVCSGVDWGGQGQPVQADNWPHGDWQKSVGCMALQYRYHPIITSVRISLNFLAVCNYFDNLFLWTFASWNIFYVFFIYIFFYKTHKLISLFVFLRGDTYHLVIRFFYAYILGDFGKCCLADDLII